MLKTCLLSTFYPKNCSTTCGEIVCQTETSFTIICKLCGMKIFDYDEFIKHFRNTHLSEIWGSGGENFVSKNQTKNECNDSENTAREGISKTKDLTKNDIEGQTSNTAQKTHFENGLEETVSSIEVVDEGSDSEDLSIFQRNSKKFLETKEKSFECDQCSRKFTTKFYLRFHLRQQHEKKNFKCDNCNKLFVEKRYLTLHQRSHIGYTCQVCHKVFDKYEALRYHCESHIQTRNFLCNYENCGKAFPNNRRLSAHKRSHFAQPSFVCEICGSRQRSKEFLIVHIRTHTGEKPYACKQCDRCFASKHFLQDHQSVHATVRSHVCTVCGKAFASSKSLYHHRHLHSNVKKYVCKICNSAYSQAAGLSAHMRKHKQDSGLLNLENTLVVSDL